MEAAPQKQSDSQSKTNSSDISREQTAIGVLAICFISVFYTVQQNGGVGDFSDLTAIILVIAQGIGFTVPALIIGTIAYIIGRVTSYPRKIMLGVTLVVAIISMLGGSMIMTSGNYDDCMLETMKGQPKGMMRYAINSCEVKYPYEKQLFKRSEYSMLNIDSFISEIDYAWSASATELAMIIEKNPSKYRVTEVTAYFTQSKCSDAAKNPTGYDLQKIFVFEDGESSKVPLDIGVYKAQCMRVDEIKGIRYKG